jgi:alanyl-tRNA synthetase
VKKVVFEEENNFLRTLESGIRRMEDYIRNATAKTVDGKAAFELYDTYGFPYDLTSLIAAEHGFTMDKVGFDAALQKQKNRSRAATELDMGDWVILDETPNSVFVGYEELESTTRLLKYRTVKAKGKEQFQLVLGQTPFYAESGGQVGDTGTLQFGDETIHVTDTKKENNLTIHFADKLPAQPAAAVKARVDKDKRHNTERHHSATHLLHAALRQVLGTHVAQKGSLVNAEALRFDFSHFAKVTDEELAQIEAIVNRKIRENIPVVIREMPKEEALKLGAMALFGEKYGDVVRVVVIDPAYSVELCGGTHISSTGELGIFKFVSEGAVAAGVRRVEAVTGARAEAFVNEQLQQLKDIKAALKNPKELVKTVETLLQDKTALEKQLEAMELEKVRALAAGLRGEAEQINGVNFLGRIVNVSNAEGLKQLAMQLKNDIPDHVLVFVANIGGKASVALSIDEKLVASRGWEAPKLIKEQIAPLIKGGGGGQKSFATAGGQNIDKLDQVVAEVKKAISL